VNVKDCSLLQIFYLDGEAPVQAIGEVCGYPFYFRARGSAWTFAVATYHTAPDPFAALAGEQQGFVLSKLYGPPGAGAASAMPENTARAILQRCGRAFAAFIDDMALENQRRVVTQARVQALT
jgi:hypothetical protein